jgi:hypothetical protein
MEQALTDFMDRIRRYEEVYEPMSDRWGVPGLRLVWFGLVWFVLVWFGLPLDQFKF